jgi:hypothetical protein
LRLVTATHTHRPGAARLTGTIEKERTGERVEAYFHYQVPDAGFVEAAADPFAAAMLLPCMRAGEALEIVPPLSPQMCFSLPRIRDIFHTWWPHFTRSELRVTPRASVSPPASERAATFFSGGVDSFYTLLKHRCGAGTLAVPLTHVIFMRGIENKLQWTEGVEGSEAWVQEVAAATGVQCIVGESNIRMTLQGLEANLHWERHYHGSALAATGLALYPGLGYVCIPSAFTYNHLVAHGSTALVDEMYSTERLRLVHDGAEATRALKVAKIVEWDRDLVLSHLRVCLMNRGGAFNCGKCYKCVRTAVPLRVLGLWEAARTFPDKSMDHWEETIAQDHLALTEENLQFARERGGDRALISMLEGIVHRRRRRQTAVAFVQNSPPLDRLLPVIRRVNSYFARR